MYLHLLDSSRDKSLVNKSADLLTEEEKVPGCWWDPIPHKGLTYGVHDDTARYRWYGPRKPEDGQHQASKYSKMEPVNGKEGATAAGQGKQRSAAAAGQQEQASKME
jgi:hypothetical protein